MEEEEGGGGGGGGGGGEEEEEEEEEEDVQKNLYVPIPKQPQRNAQNCYQFITN